MIFHLGGERSSRAIARRILARRADRPFERTSELAELVVRVLGRERLRPTRRDAHLPGVAHAHVNDELGELARALAAAERALRSDGRLLVVSFHSLEDGLTKQFLRERAAPAAHGSRHLPPEEPHRLPPSFRFVNPRPVSPKPEEIAANPQCPFGQVARGGAYRRAGLAGAGSRVRDEL